MRHDFKIKKPTKKLERCPCGGWSWSTVNNLQVQSIWFCPYREIQFFTMWMSFSCHWIVDKSAFFHSNEGNVPRHGINGFQLVKDFFLEEMANKQGYCWDLVVGTIVQKAFILLRARIFRTGVLVCSPWNDWYSWKAALQLLLASVQDIWKVSIILKTQSDI